MANVAISPLASGCEYTSVASASTLSTPKKATAAALNPVSGPERSRSLSAALIDSTASQ